MAHTRGRRLSLVTSQCVGILSSNTSQLTEWLLAPLTVAFPGIDGTDKELCPGTWVTQAPLFAVQALWLDLPGDCCPRC